MKITLQCCLRFGRMTRTSPLSEDFLGFMHMLRRNGYTYGQIAKLTKKSRSTIQYALKRTVICQNSSCKSKLGRPRVTTNRTDTAISTWAKRHRFHTNVSIANEFGVSKQTVGRRLREGGLLSRRAVVDFLTDHQRRNRRMWCRNRLNCNFSTWLFSDECAFELSNCSAVQRAWVHRKVGEKYLKCCVLRAPVKGRQKVDIWGCISSIGVARLRILTRTVNRHVCIETYVQELLPMLDELPLSWERKVVFQQDNARPHVAHDTINFLEENVVTIAEWPPYSPDLNPIENVWAIMKRIVCEMEPQNVEQLTAAIKKAWGMAVTKKLCKSLFWSMRARLYRVIRKRGLW